MNLPDVTEDALVQKADPALPGGSEMGRAIEAFLDFVEAQHQKHMQAQDLDPFAYDPEHTEHLEQFDGGYAPASGRVVLCTEVKGLRYEGQRRRRRAPLRHQGARPHEKHAGLD